MLNPMIRLATVQGSVVLLAVNRIECIEPICTQSCQITTYGSTISVNVQHSLVEVEEMMVNASTNVDDS